MSPVEQIKQKLDIVEFIGQYVQLKKAGRNFKANCPFHQEKSPSFVISPDRQIWHCFGSCGTGGDVVSFWMKWENLSFQEALRELAQVTGIQLDTSTYDDQAFNKKEKILSINNLAARFYGHILTKLPIGTHALEYLRNRGLNDRIIQTFEIGYGPSSWDSLIHFFQKKNIKEVDLYEAGLVVQAASGNRYYDRFRNRIVFPIKDGKGNVIAFSGRVLGGDGQGAKYVNTPETDIYHKRESLYGIHLTKDAIRKEGNVYIVEGEFDMITPYQHGIENVVAIKGAALTQEQLSTLKRYTNKITLALDTDEAGIEAMKRGIREAEKQDFDIQVVQLTSGKDPDEAIHNDFVSFKKDLKKPIPIYDFLLEHFTKKYAGDSPFQKKKIGEEMAPFIAHIENPIVHSHYIKKIAHLLDVDSESVEKIIRNQKYKEKRSFRSSVLSKSKPTSEIETHQKTILSYILQRENLDDSLAQTVKTIEMEDFTLPAYQNVFKKISEYINQSNSYSYTLFIQTLPPELTSVCDELFLMPATQGEMPQKNVAELIRKLKILSTKYYLGISTKENNQEKVFYYNKRLHELSKTNIEKTL